MKISKKAEYALRAVIKIARHSQMKPIQISEISESEIIPVKFLEQILVILKKESILKSKRGANGGYLLNKNPRDISVGIILETIDGPFQPINYEPHSEVALGLQLCFDEMVKMVQKHLYEFSIQEIIDNDNPPNSLAFEI